jgi:predicted GIY-YIG superfamily endonuclease
MDTIEIKKHHVYILFDENKNTYVGYTVNPERRIKQHNRVLVGGAKFTSRHSIRSGDPWHWKFLMVVHCSEFTYNSALSFEWSMKYPTNKRPQPFKTPEARINALPLVFRNPKFSHLHFFVELCEHKYMHLLNNALEGVDNVTIKI